MILGNRITLFAAAALLAVATRCTNPPAPPLQTGSETTSGVEIGVAGMTIQGKTAPAATVIVAPAHSKPGGAQAAKDTATADDSGAFAFTNLAPGPYNIFVFGPEAKGAAIFGVPVGADGPNGPFEDSAAFAALLTITGTVMHAGSPDSLSQVYIQGSPFFTATDGRGKFSFVDIPEGVYTVIAVSSQRRSPPDSVTVDCRGKKGQAVTVELNGQ